MHVVVYVLCFDDESEGLARASFGSEAWARILRIETTLWLENIVFERLLEEHRDEWKGAEYVGTISYKANEKMGAWSMEDAYRRAKGQDADVIALKTHFGDSMLPTAEHHHPGFCGLWFDWLAELRISGSVATMSGAGSPFYCNYWLAKPEWMDRYIAFFRRAQEALIRTPHLQDRLWADSRYGGRMPEDRRMEVFGRAYYPFHTFLLERLPNLFFHMEGALVFHR